MQEIDSLLGIGDNGDHAVGAAHNSVKRSVAIKAGLTRRQACGIPDLTLVEQRIKRIAPLPPPGPTVGIAFAAGEQGFVPRRAGFAGGRRSRVPELGLRFCGGPGWLSCWRTALGCAWESWLRRSEWRRRQPQAAQSRRRGQRQSSRTILYASAHGLPAPVTGLRGLTRDRGGRHGKESGDGASAADRRAGTHRISGRASIQTGKREIADVDDAREPAQAREEIHDAVIGAVHLDPKGIS